MNDLCHLCRAQLEAELNQIREQNAELNQSNVHLQKKINDQMSKVGQYFEAIQDKFNTLW